MTPYEISSLWAQWVGSISGFLAVVVAAVFGYLTLLNNRRANDAQERASLAAVLEPPAPQGLRAQPRKGAFGIRHAEGETWLLVNEGTEPALDVRVEGLTELDRRRLSAAPRPALAPGEALEFALISRLTLSGPANVVVTYRLDGDGVERRRVLQVPSA